MTRGRFTLAGLAVVAVALLSTLLGSPERSERPAGPPAQQQAFIRAQNLAVGALREHAAYARLHGRFAPDAQAPQTRQLRALAAQVAAGRYGPGLTMQVISNDQAISMSASWSQPGLGGTLRPYFTLSVTARSVRAGDHPNLGCSGPAWTHCARMNTLVVGAQGPPGVAN